METIKETNKALSALIIINNDRYEGYKKAAEETKDADLKEIFTRFSNQSRGFSEELRKLFSYQEASEPEKDETTTAGKLFRVWMDIKSALATKDRKAILASCEFGEDVAKRAYSEVVDKPGDVSLEVLTVV